MTPWGLGKRRPPVPYEPEDEDEDEDEDFYNAVTKEQP